MAKAMVQKEEATAILRKAMAMVNRQVAMAKVMEKVMEKLVVIATGMGEDMETPMATGEDMMDMEMGMEQKDMDMDMATEKLAATATAMGMATGKCQVQCSLEAKQLRMKHILAWHHISTCTATIHAEVRVLYVLIKL